MILISVIANVLIPLSTAVLSPYLKKVLAEFESRLKWQFSPVANRTYVHCCQPVMKRSKDLPVLQLVVRQSKGSFNEYWTQQGIK